MKNYGIEIRFDGTEFAGWQVQPGVRTVQGVVEERLAGFLNEDVRVMGAGRTDAGVHALHYVAAFRSGTSLSSAVMERALGKTLPPDIALLRLAPAGEQFDPRRHALSRLYRYRIVKGKDPLLHRFAWEVTYALDRRLMERASRDLIGEHDYTSFAASTRKGMENRVRVLEAEWSETEQEICFQIRANRFLHRMVRNIVGTIVEIGRGARPPGGIPGLIAARERESAGPTAPPHGLYLVEIEYGDGWDAPASVEGD